MNAREQSTWAIWIACVGIGLLYLIRSFQNYMSPMFGDLSHGVTPSRGVDVPRR